MENDLPFTQLLPQSSAVFEDHVNAVLAARKAAPRMALLQANPDD